MPEQIGFSFAEPCPTVERIPLLDAELRFYREAFSVEESAGYFDHLLATTPWRQDEMSIHGRTIPLPRLQAWYSDTADLSYSGMVVSSHAWTETLKSIHARIAQLTGLHFNGVLVTCYRDGRDSVGWHSDDEAEFGPDPIIASVSFGATRDFVLKHRFDKTLIPVKLPLNDGSLLIMGSKVQTHWQHQLPKRKRVTTPRINLTFRNIV